MLIVTLRNRSECAPTRPTIQLPRFFFARFNRATSAFHEARHVTPDETPLEQIGESLARLVVLADDKQSRGSKELKVHLPVRRL